MKQTIVIFLPYSAYKYRDIPSALEKIGIKDIIKRGDFSAFKLHFGEKGNLGYIRPELIKPIIKQVKELGATPFLTDANTIYRGERSDAARHLMVAAEHNFHPKFLGAPVIIADGLRGNSYVEVEIGQKHFKKVKVAEAIYNADSIVCVSHFKGHELCGFGGAIKNLGMGCAAKPGKFEQHCNAKPSVKSSRCVACGLCVKWCGGKALSLKQSSVIARNAKRDEAIPCKQLHTGDCHAPSGLAMTISLDPKKCTGCGQCVHTCPEKVFSLPWDGEAKEVQEKMVEYAFGAAKDKRAVYVNFLTFITQSCDCMKTTTKPIMPDIGILVSTDPVAIDQACLDMVTEKAGRDILKEVTGMDGSLQLAYAEKIGLGSREYVLSS